MTERLELHGVGIGDALSDEQKALMQRLYEDPTLRHRMGRSGRAKIMEQFNLRFSALELTTLFRNGGS